VPPFRRWAAITVARRIEEGRRTMQRSLKRIASSAEAYSSVPRRMALATVN
jgi:hypothetical protein